jgi:hypothetical protein
MIIISNCNYILYNTKSVNALSMTYKSYDGYKSQILNNFVNVITFPFDFIKYSVCKSLSLIFSEIPILFIHSPFILYYGLHHRLKQIDDWLVPDPRRD